ncbi:hypothetical protein KCP73_13710 [Salmonella enterica subsp. enterica]|nr:hypothetical protein KCP73_13710 [Salmonella enterica subsp. enterica]
MSANIGNVTGRLSAGSATAQSGTIVIHRRKHVIGRIGALLRPMSNFWNCCWPGFYARAMVADKLQYAVKSR